MPARPTRRRQDPNAGPAIVDERTAPLAAPPSPSSAVGSALRAHEAVQESAMGPALRARDAVQESASPGAAASRRGPGWLDVPDRTGKRRTLDLAREDDDALEDRLRAAARVAGVSSRQLNAQHVIRAMVHRFVTDQAFADSIMLVDVLEARQ